MTVPSIVSRDNYVGNGAASVYAYNFKIFANTDLVVTVADLNDAETTLVLATDYTVDGVGDATGGNVTLVSAGQAWLDTDGDLLTSFALTIRRVRPVTQTTDIRNQGPYAPEDIEDSLDHGIMVAQQRQDDADRSLKLPETEAGLAVNTVIPSVANRASMVLAFNAAGEIIAQANVPSGAVAATAYMKTLLDDTDAATARDTLLIGPNEYTPAAITTSQNNYDVTGGGTMRQFVIARLSATANVNVTGFLGGTVGMRLTVINVDTAENITLPHQDTGSLAANRMIMVGSADLTLAPGDSAELVYDNTDSRWRQIS